MNTPTKQFLRDGQGNPVRLLLHIMLATEERHYALYDVPVCDDCNRRLDQLKAEREAIQ